MVNAAFRTNKIKLGCGGRTTEQGDGVGLIAWDYIGHVWASMCSFHPYISDPSTDEAFAARQGVALCHDLGFQSIESEGDAQEIVSSLKKEHACLGKYGSLIADARNLLMSFWDWAVSYVWRDKNVATHQLARRAMS